eukprot:7130344-Prymnesium_polylepis.3
MSACQQEGGAPKLELARGALPGGSAAAWRTESVFHKRIVELPTKTTAPGTGGDAASAASKAAMSSSKQRASFEATRSEKIGQRERAWRRVQTVDHAARASQATRACSTSHDPSATSSTGTSTATSARTTQAAATRSGGLAVCCDT